MALKITRHASLQGDAVHCYSILLTLGKGGNVRTINWQVDFTGDPQTRVPLLLTAEFKPNQFWICKGKVFRVEGAELLDRDELVLRIKHAALAEEKELKRIQREIEAFDNLQATAAARREHIPDDVKLFEELTSYPELDRGDWVLVCLACGARNIIIPVFKLVGWR
jgi:hypothetical protein